MNCIKKSLTTSNRQDLKVHSRVHRCPAGPLQPAPDQGHHRQGRYGPLHLGEQKCALYAVIPDNDQTFNFLVSLLYSQAFQALYYSADQIYHGALPCHVHFVLDEFAAMPLPGFTRELATMRSRNISASTIIQNMAQIKELYKDSLETIPGNLDTILYLGGNEASTHKYISEALGKATIDTKTHGQTKGNSGSYSTNFQMSGRELLTPDEVRGLDNRYAILFIRGAKPVMDLKYELTEHPAIRHTIDGGGPPYIHHQEKPEPKFQGEPLFALETEISDEEKETELYEDFPEVPDPQEAPEHPGAPEED